MDLSIRNMMMGTAQNDVMPTQAALTTYVTIDNWQDTNVHYSLVQWYAVAQRVECWTGNQQVVGSNPTRGKLRNNLGQVVHTYVLLSLSSITWYWPMGGDVLQLGR